jgi:Fur family ferric uptake transcriptional regulator
MERNTRQRTAIRDAIAQSGRPLLPQEVLEAAQASTPGLSIATVYRNLKSLTDDGTLRTVLLPGENARYELAHTGHHHHFQCRQCQRVFEVDACPGDLSHLAPAGFTVDDHDLTLYGRCAECAPVPTATRRARSGPGPGKRQEPSHDHDHGHSHDHGHRHDTAYGTSTMRTAPSAAATKGARRSRRAPG